MYTAEIIKAIAPHASDRLVIKYLSFLNQYLGNVNTPYRMAAFISNLLHESGCFIYVKELASGEAYEGRADLGNAHPGDGKKFKGRGLIQITGRSNYALISNDWFGDDRLLSNPELLETPELAVKSAYWFWDKRKLNAIADVPDFIKVVKRINGVTNGLADRQGYYNRALVVFGVKS